MEEILKFKRDGDVELFFDYKTPYEIMKLRCILSNNHQYGNKFMTLEVLKDEASMSLVCCEVRTCKDLKMEFMTGLVFFTDIFIIYADGTVRTIKEKEYARMDKNYKIHNPETTADTDNLVYLDLAYNGSDLS